MFVKTKTWYMEYGHPSHNGNLSNGYVTKSRLTKTGQNGPKPTPKKILTVPDGSWSRPEELLVRCPCAPPRSPAVPIWPAEQQENQQKQLGQLGQLGWSETWWRNCKSDCNFRSGTPWSQKETPRCTESPNGSQCLLYGSGFLATKLKKCRAGTGATSFCFYQDSEWRRGLQSTTATSIHTEFTLYQTRCVLPQENCCPCTGCRQNWPQSGAQFSWLAIQACGPSPVLYTEPPKRHRQPTRHLVVYMVFTRFYPMTWTACLRNSLQQLLNWWSWHSVTWDWAK